MGQRTVADKQLLRKMTDPIKTKTDPQKSHLPQDKITLVCAGAPHIAEGAIKKLK